MSETGHAGGQSSGRSSGWRDGLLTWPDGIARLGVVFAVGVAVAFVFAYLPRALGRLGDEASRNSSLSFADREIAGGNSILPDQLAAYEARALIPEHDTYRVVVGPKLTKSTPLTAGFTDDWLAYFLMPRRPSHAARWIVCIGCNSSELGARYEALWHDDVGLSVGRLLP